MEQERRNYNWLTSLESLTEDDINWVKDELERGTVNNNARVVAQLMVNRLYEFKPTTSQISLGVPIIVHKCLCCGNGLQRKARYCDWCGQRIKWED